MPSRIENCYLIGDPLNPLKEPMFEFVGEGKCIVTMNGYLVAPIRAFSNRHIQNIKKRLEK